MTDAERAALQRLMMRGSITDWRTLKAAIEERDRLRAELAERERE